MLHVVPDVASSSVLREHKQEEAGSGRQAALLRPHEWIQRTDQAFGWERPQREVDS